jgi:hypothetical protein
MAFTIFRKIVPPPQAIDGRLCGSITAHSGFAVSLAHIHW